MRVAECMTRTVATVHPHDTLHHAMSLMHQRNCGCVVVIDDCAHPLALLTDRDVGLAALRIDRPLSGIEVGDAMGGRVHVCRSDDSIATVEDAMVLHQVRRLPVIDGDRRLIGIVTLDDLARAAVCEVGLPEPPVSAGEVGETLGRIQRA